MFKCEQICAGPVSFEIMYFAELIREIKKLKLTGLLFSKTIFAFNFLASFISFGPGATKTGYLFLYIVLILNTNSAK